MNIVFMGTPDYARVILERILNEKINVLAVFTQPDKPVGRKQILTPPSVKQFLLDKKSDIKILQPKNLKDESIHEFLRSLNPDFIVVAAYGQILPQAVLDIAPCINLHASILPKYRGASPIQSAILDGESETGVCTMLMEAGLDTGDVLEVAKTSCLDKTSGELFDELAIMAAELIISTLRNFNQITPIKQDDESATHCKKITKQMGLVGFDDENFYNKYLAFTPWPGIFTKTGLKILNLKKSNLSGKVGEILSINKQSFVVATKNSAIEIFTLQESGKRAVSATDFINGKRLKVGDIFES
ncbi:methionyl-tRNA formyltransferase [Campylobacter majalis]|uniref:methionyl-tRNA formyltransferase n=1 Tax=Campylobacter majalis TaxID=2790656 RepID=UPI003D6966EF